MRIKQKRIHRESEPNIPLAHCSFPFFKYEHKATGHSQSLKKCATKEYNQILKDIDAIYNSRTITGQNATTEHKPNRKSKFVLDQRCLSQVVKDYSHLIDNNFTTRRFVRHWRCKTTQSINSAQVYDDLYKRLNNCFVKEEKKNKLSVLYKNVCKKTKSLLKDSKLNKENEETKANQFKSTNDSFVKKIGVKSHTFSRVLNSLVNSQTKSLKLKEQEVKENPFKIKSMYSTPKNFQNLKHDFQQHFKKNLYKSSLENFESSDINSKKKTVAPKKIEFSGNIDTHGKEIELHNHKKKQIEKQIKKQIEEPSLVPSVQLSKKENRKHKKKGQYKHYMKKYSGTYLEPVGKTEPQGERLSNKIKIRNNAEQDNEQENRKRSTKQQPKKSYQTSQKTVNVPSKENEKGQLKQQPKTAVKKISDKNTGSTVVSSIDSSLKKASEVDVKKPAMLILDDNKRNSVENLPKKNAKKELKHNSDLISKEEPVPGVKKKALTGNSTKELQKSFESNSETVTKGTPIKQHTDSAIVKKGSPIKQHSDSEIPTKGSHIKQHSESEIAIKKTPIKQHSDSEIATKGSPIKEHSESEIAIKEMPIKQHSDSEIATKGSPIKQHSESEIAVKETPIKQHSDSEIATKGSPTKQHTDSRIATKGLTIKQHSDSEIATKEMPIKQHSDSEIAMKETPVKRHSNKSVEKPLKIIATSPSILLFRKKPNDKDLRKASKVSFITEMENSEKKILNKNKPLNISTILDKNNKDNIQNGKSGEAPNLKSFPAQDIGIIHDNKDEKLKHLITTANNKKSDDRKKPIDEKVATVSGTKAKTKLKDRKSIRRSTKKQSLGPDDRTSVDEIIEAFEMKIRNARNSALTNDGNAPDTKSEFSFRQFKLSSPEKKVKSETYNENLPLDVVSGDLEWLFSSSDVSREEQIKKLQYGETVKRNKRSELEPKIDIDETGKSGGTWNFLRLHDRKNPVLLPVPSENYQSLQTQWESKPKIAKLTLIIDELLRREMQQSSTDTIADHHAEYVKKIEELDSIFDFDIEKFDRDTKYMLHEPFKPERKKSKLYSFDHFFWTTFDFAKQPKKMKRKKRRFKKANTVRKDAKAKIQEDITPKAVGTECELCKYLNRGREELQSPLIKQMKVIQEKQELQAYYKQMKTEELRNKKANNICLFCGGFKTNRSQEQRCRNVYISSDDNDRICEPISDCNNFVQRMAKQLCENRRIIRENCSFFYDN